MIDPRPDCSLCDRLVAFRRDNQAKYPDFFNGAVPSFGDSKAWMMIVGLAPGLKGANATGRPFTGDYAGDLLYECLLELGLADGVYQKHPEDGLTLKGALITNAVRCVPPQNKPTPKEIHTCRPFLTNTLDAMPSVKVLFVLGRIAHEQVLRTLGLKLSDYAFGHGACHALPTGLTMVDSYHCSRYNVNTGRLTKAMFLDAFRVAIGAKA